MNILAKLGLYYHTLRYLRAEQLGYRIYYRLRNSVWHRDLARLKAAGPVESHNLVLTAGVPRNSCYADDCFTFLNLTQAFPGGIDWQFMGHGKLWCYNLNYFDFLHQEGLTEKEGCRLIRHYAERLPGCAIGNEPYPTSLRIINWLKFLARHGISDELIDKSLHAQAQMLAANLEYHLLGNHLLENAFALLFAGCYFRNERLFGKGAAVLAAELREQVLPDGGHFELSPMYHQIILDRLLDCINLLRHNEPPVGASLLEMLIEKASLMLGWLGQLTFSNGDIPLVNDAAYGIAPTTAELFAYAARLGVGEKFVPLAQSGYRKISHPGYEMVIDVGNIGPDYIPGHAHSDTFSFVLYLGGAPCIVDTGTSTYEAGELRLNQRRTAAHNTVQVDGLDQSEVWGNFRVARRAHVLGLQEEQGKIAATHTGYDRINARHRREFVFSANIIRITDEVVSQEERSCAAFLHFHPDCVVHLEGDTVIVDGRSITFGGASEVQVGDYGYAPRFNAVIPAKLVTVLFSGRLQTEIRL
jgi:uncharacterized heparinase superfamily protein